MSLLSTSQNIHSMKKTSENIFMNLQIVKVGKRRHEMNRLSVAIYDEGKGKEETICVSLSAANICNCSHVNIDTLATSMTLTMTSFSTKETPKMTVINWRCFPRVGVVKVERKNHETDVRFVHPDQFVRKIYLHTRCALCKITQKQEDIYQLILRCNGAIST